MRSVGILVAVFVLAATATGAASFEDGEADERVSFETPFLLSLPASEACRAPAVDILSFGSSVESGTLTLWAAIADPAAGVECPGLRERLASRSWSLWRWISPAEGIANFTFAEWEQRGTAPPTFSLRLSPGIGYGICDVRGFQASETAGVFRVSLPVAGIANCPQPVAYNLSGFVGLGRARSVSEGRLCTEPLCVSQAYFAYDETAWVSEAVD